MNQIVRPPGGKMRVGAFVMTYMRPAVLKETLTRLLSQTRPPDVILIVDNEGCQATAQVGEQLGDPRVTYQCMPDNRGPAGAAAVGLQRLSQEGCDWIYWGDDNDPPAFPDDLGRLVTIAAAATEDVPAVGIGGCLFNWTTGESERLLDSTLLGVIEVDQFAGNGHWLFRREAVVSVGVPDERLFFGFEEMEYSLRLRREGWRLLIDGERLMDYRRKNGRVGLSNRPRPGLAGAFPWIPWRQYYSTRNYIFMMRRCFNRHDLARKEVLKAVGRSVVGSLRGPYYCAALALLQARAIIDGYAGRMGRLVEPVAKAE
jgi:glycosyltransferase involved in cell wall biosynthesis